MGKGEYDGSLVGKLRQQKQAMWTDLQPWRDRYTRLSEYIMPFNGRFTPSDANKANQGFNKIYDSTGTDALETLVAGLHQRASSPASKWMILSTPDPKLNKRPRVKRWLERQTDRMLQAFRRSNTYTALPHYYLEMALFGTACGVIVPHRQRTIHHHMFTAGQYALGTDGEDVVNVMFREFEQTVGQMVDMWGMDAVSDSVKDAFKNKRFQQRRTICHAVFPRHHYDRIPGSMLGKDKPWASVYFEYEGRHGKLPSEPLRVSGFDRFPVVAPRWNVVGGNVYGTSLGMKCLGDIITLQKQTIRKGQAIDFQSNPPTQGQAKLEEVDKRPGGHTTTSGDNAKIETVYDGRYFSLNDMQQDLVEIRERINRGMLAFIFLLQAQNPQDITALQAQFIEQEKMTLLGPTQERIENELLRVTVDNSFDAMLQMGEVEPWPEELDDMELGVDFLSPLAQAQRAVGASTSDRVEMKVRSLADIDPSIIDHFDGPGHFKRYVDRVGGASEDIRPEEEVRTLRERREQMQMQAAQLAAAEQGANAAKTAAEAEQIAGGQ